MWRHGGSCQIGKFRFVYIMAICSEQKSEFVRFSIDQQLKFPSKHTPIFHWKYIFKMKVYQTSYLENRLFFISICRKVIISFKCKCVKCSSVLPNVLVDNESVIKHLFEKLIVNRSNTEQNTLYCHRSQLPFCCLLQLPAQPSWMLPRNIHMLANTDQHL